MRIAYVNIWPGFELNDYPEKCFFTRILREVDPQLQVDIGMHLGAKYDIIFSMFIPNKASSTYQDMNKVDCKSICFSPENVGDAISITPGCGAYISFSDIQRQDIKYLKFPFYTMCHYDYLYRFNCSSFEELKAKFKKNFYEKKYSVAISNPNNQLRTEVLRILVSMGLCYSGGSVYNNTGQIGWEHNSKIEFSSKTMYGMAFENSSKIGYITEKIYECFIAGTVPYYWGAPDIKEEFNPKAYHIFDSSNEQMANKSMQHMIEVLSNDNLRQSMIDIDPFTGFKSDVWIKNGKQIVKDFIMNYIETK